MFFASFLWGLNGIFIRNISSFSFFGITLGRLLFAFLPFFIFILSAKKNRMELIKSLKDFKIFIVLGFLMAFTFIFSVLSYKLTYIATAQTLNSIGMFFTVLLAPVFLKECVSKKDLFGMIIAFSGVMLILGIDSSALDNNFLKGDIVALLASLFAALYGILVRKHKLEHPFYINMFWIFAIAFVFVFLISQILQMPFIISDINLVSIFNLLALGVFGTCIGHSILNKSFYVLRSEKALTISLSSVLFSYFLALVFFREVIGFWTLIGVLLTIFGVYIVIRSNND